MGIVMPLLNEKYEYVYLLKEDGTNLVKIGSTNHLDTRRVQLNTGNARKLIPYKVIKTGIGKSLVEERRLQRIFKEYNTNKILQGGMEWFDDSMNDIQSFFDDNSHQATAEEFEGFKTWFEKLDEYSSTTSPYYTTYLYVRDNIIPYLSDNDVIAFAPPKSGKKIVAWLISLLMPEAFHLYITAQDKKDMGTQLESYAKFRVKAVSVTNRGKITNTLKSQLFEDLRNYEGMIIAHFDECDFGSGAEQKINNFINNELKPQLTANSKLRYVSYSATPEEAIFSERPYHIAQYIPGPNYNGPQWFLDNSLVENPEPFFSIQNSNLVISKQAESLLNGLLSSSKEVAVTRLTGNIDKKPAFKTASRHLQAAIDKHIGSGKIKVHFYDQKKPFDWFFNEDEFGDWVKMQNDGLKHLIVIANLCSRGTEVGFHPMIYAWHDYRRPVEEEGSTSYATLAQAAGRVFHYISDYKRPERIAKFGHADTKIKLYMEKTLIELMAKMYSAPTRTIAEYKEIWAEYSKNQNSRMISSRVKHSEGNDWETSPVTAILNDDGVDFVKQFIMALIKRGQKRLSGGVGSAKGSKTIDYCEAILSNKNPKGRNPTVFMIEENYINSDEYHKKDPTPTKSKTDNYVKMIGSQCLVVEDVGPQELVDFYLSQEINIVEMEVLKDLAKAKGLSVNKIDIKEYLKNAHTKLGKELLGKRLHPLVLYQNPENRLISDNTVHNSM